jgi:hypothetical protein
MISEAAGRLQSYDDAAYALGLAQVKISSRHVQRIASEIGSQLATRRDEKVVQQRRRELPVRVAAIPEAVAVEVDGGRLRTRAMGEGPGVHQQQNKEDKVAAFVTLQTQEHQADPQPEPPESFLEPRRVQRLVQQMQGQAGERPQEEEKKEDASTPQADEPAQPERPPSPHKRVRTCLASMACSREFGPMMAAEAQQRGFYRAKKRSFLGDGAPYNWTIHRGYFPDFEAITDFLHVLCYVYLAAWAAGSDEAERWSIYVSWMRACWQGRVREVIEELRLWQSRIGEPPEDEEVDAKDPRRLVAEAWSYLSNNEGRMDYPRYRKEGLPITSSLVESLVGEVNARVKSKQKYFNRPDGAEAILQLRAAVLSEDDRLKRFFEQRPGNPHRRRKAG